MTVSLVSWRAVIGIFNCRISVMSEICESHLVNNFTCLIESLLLFYHYFESAYIVLFTLLYVFALLQCHGDIEVNPGPKKLLNNKSLSICHWNLNSLTAHNYSKLTQLKAYISIYKHDFACLSETYLDSLTPNSLLEIDGYNLIRADHPNNTKRGGVCIYYKEPLPVRVIGLPYLKEALLLELTDNNKKIFISVIYRSPSQNNREFNLFLSSFEQLLNEINQRKPMLSIITGDFNPRSFSWWANDSSTLEGTSLYSLASSNSFCQLINEPTHIQRNSSSCIDLIFTDQPSLAVNSGVHASLHPNCHHQIIHTSFNLNITYPSPYKRLIWDYKKTDSEKIRKALDWVNWESLFNNKDVNTQVSILNETVLNVFSNYVPNKYITIDDKDPVWMNETIKLKIKAKNSMYNRFIQNGRSESDFVLLETLITELNELIATTKALYMKILLKTK